MRSAMISISSDFIFLIKLVRDRIEIRRGRHSLVERSIEDSDLRNVGKDGFNGEDTFEVGGIMQRRYFDATFYALYDGGGYLNAGFEALAAIHDPVAHGCNFVFIGDHAKFRILKGTEDEVDADLMIGDKLRGLVLVFSGDLVCKQTTFEADPVE
jgi:hypothetical protein